MWAQSHTQSPTRATQSRCIGLCLVEELKNLSRNSTFPTHKYNTVKEGEASSLLLSFCLFSISHNTNQAARLSRLQTRQQCCSPWQQQPKESFGMVSPPWVQPHELLSLPCQPGALNWGHHPNWGQNPN